MDRSRTLTGYADGMEEPPFGKVLACPRPTCLREFVGQHRLKSLINTTVASAKQRNAPFPHTAVSGQAGNGKTTIASIIAYEMGVNFIPVSPDSLEDTHAVRELMRSISDFGYDRLGKVIDSIRPPVIFIDEAHRLPRQSQELLYSCLEDRILDTEVHIHARSKVKHPRFNGKCERFFGA